jgi:hypothetical protein
MGIILAAVCAFAASSLWYSPVLFGRQFLALTGVTTSAKPDGLKIAAEMRLSQTVSMRRQNANFDARVRQTC